MAAHAKYLVMGLMIDLRKYFRGYHGRAGGICHNAASHEF